MPRLMEKRSTDAVPMTREGRRKLEERRQYLITVKSKEISERIREASSHGDLRENSGYEVAMHDQHLNNSETDRIRHDLKHGVLIEAVDSMDCVSLGHPVTVQEVDATEESIEVYTIVGIAEADPGSGLISNVSPMGRALLGGRLGEVVEFETAAQVWRYRIRNIGE